MKVVNEAYESMTVLNGAKAELAAQCRERGMPEEEIAATFDSLQEMFATESGAAGLLTSVGDDYAPVLACGGQRTHIKSYQHILYGFFRVHNT